MTEGIKKIPRLARCPTHWDTTRSHPFRTAWALQRLCSGFGAPTPWTRVLQGLALPPRRQGTPQETPPSCLRPHPSPSPSLSRPLLLMQLFYTITPGS